MEIMEVRLRPERAAKLRAQRVILWVSLLLLVVGVAAGGYLAATRGAAWLFWKNPDYNIAVLDVETDGVITRDAVLDAAEVHEGMNIFRLDLDKAKARIETLPQVQRVLIQRQLPNKVSILIAERKPVAWIAPDTGTKTREEVFASPRSFLVDATGVLLRPRKVLAQNYQLPVIRNANADRLAPGQTADSEEVRAALDLLRAHGESLVGARFRVDEIDLARGYGLLVRDRGGLQVLFGLDDPELQLKTLDTVLSAVANSGRRPATISLMTLEARQRNIPVTFQPDPPPPAPPSPEPSPASAATPTNNGSVPPSPSPSSPAKDREREAEVKKDPVAAKAPPKTETASTKPTESKHREKVRPKHHGDGREGSRHHAATVSRPHEKKETSPAKPAITPTVRKALPVVQPFQ